jgi:hypothetical protein
MNIDNCVAKQYNLSMKQKAPISVEAPTGAVVRTAEAARVSNSSIRLLVVNFNRRFHNELPGLQSEITLVQNSSYSE